MKVKELRDYLSDKHDDQEVKIDMIPTFRVDVVPLAEVKPDEGAAPAVAEPVAV